MIKTLFSPWKKISYGYGRGFDIKRYFEAITFNLMSRIVGGIIRTFFIIFATFIEIIVIISGLLIIILWLIAPFIFFYGIYFAINLI